MCQKPDFVATCLLFARMHHPTYIAFILAASSTNAIAKEKTQTENLPLILLNTTLIVVKSYQIRIRRLELASNIKQATKSKEEMG